MEIITHAVPIARHAAAAAVALILLLGSLAKLRDLALFRAVVEGYRLVPQSLIAAVAMALPLIELMAGVSLLPVATRSIGAWLAIGVLAVVTSAVAANVVRGRRDVDCGCGGEGLPLGPRLLVRNAALLALALVALLPPRPGAQVWLDAVVAMTATLFLVGLYHAGNLWIAQQHRLDHLRNSP